MHCTTFAKYKTESENATATVQYYSTVLCTVLSSESIHPAADLLVQQMLQGNGGRVMWQEQRVTWLVGPLLQLFCKHGSGSVECCADIFPMV